uniref:NTF2 domain-containing protein n=1 Tax=Ananas comosus var. bracteatus TaxID=296719 RepID=A0A6V7P0I5_ANACO|nr:unnamed protein product [Ananas comosus var. bracteatus]
MDPDGVARGVRGALLQDVRREPGGAGGPVPGGVDADVRGRQDPGRAVHRRQAHLPPLPAVPPPHLHRRLPALRPQGGMLVFVSGAIQLAGENHQLKFSQMFHLMPTPQGSFYVLNDIFRLNYA